MVHQTALQRVLAQTSKDIIEMDKDIKEAQILFDKLEAEGLGTPETRRSLEKAKRKLESLRRVTR